MTEENLNPEEIVTEITVADEPVIEPVAEVAVEKVEEVKETPKPAPVKSAPAKQEQKYATPVAVSIDDIENSKPKPAGPAVVSNKEVDDVFLDKIIYKNLYARKSLSVHHLQRRLFELGYTEAHDDKDGFYGDKTKSAVLRFQLENKLEANGMVDAKTLTVLFTGDPNVNVIL